MWLPRYVTAADVVRVAVCAAAYAPLCYAIVLLSDASSYLSLASKALGGMVLGLAVHTTYVRTKLNDAEDTEYLSASESKRLGLMLNERRGHLMWLTSFYLVLALINFCTAWIAQITSRPLALAVFGLTLNLLALTGALHSQREAFEAERFKSKLIRRHRSREERRAALQHLNADRS